MSSRITNFTEEGMTLACDDLEQTILMNAFRRPFNRDVIYSMFGYLLHNALG